MNEAAIGYPQRFPAGRTERPPVAHRRPLDATLIVSEAVAFIDEQGRDRLTMRHLGARLGVEAMALYRYVAGREQLLDAVVELVMNELYQDSGVDKGAGTWQEYLQRLAHGVRTMALAHPQIFPLVVTRPAAAPWLRPPLRSLRWVESFLRVLDGFGLSRTTIVLTYQAFATFLLGHLLLETASGAISDNEGREDMEFLESSNLSDYPMISELSTELSGEGFDGEFEAALEDLIDRLDVVISGDRAKS